MNFLDFPQKNTEIIADENSALVIIGIVSISIVVYAPVVVPEGKENVLEGMVLIPGGEFEMGSNNTPSEQPMHTVYLDAFYMDQHEVTNAEYKTFVLADPEWQKEHIDARFHEGTYLEHWDGNTYPNGKGDHPVTWVSWHAAMAYATWAGKRLPTEAEWERAARGGLTDQNYPWGGSIDVSRANYNGNLGDTTAVGVYLDNDYGLYDMAGNVWEWCLDAYQSDFYEYSPRRNPIVGATPIRNMVSDFRDIETSRVLRGGSLFTERQSVAVSTRAESPPLYADFDLGFRCVTDTKP